MDDQSRYSQILDVAEGIVRSRGFNGFSYADISNVVGVSKASVHHHFPTKSDLGLQLIARFEESVFESLEEIDHSTSNNLIKLREYAGIFEGSMHENKMCLCGMLAAEHDSLSDQMQEAIGVFFERNEAWVEKVMRAGLAAGEIKIEGSPTDQARMFIANLQGALLIAKSMQSLERMTSVAFSVVESYRVKRTH